LEFEEPFEILRGSNRASAKKKGSTLDQDAILRFGSPAWIRTTITTTNTQSRTYRVFNGLECQIGPEKPALVHNSYTESGSRTDPAKEFLDGDNLSRSSGLVPSNHLPCLSAIRD